MCLKMGDRETDKNNFLVIGYYSRGNLGDESYKGIMGRFFEGKKLEFVSSDDLGMVNPEKYDAVIVGGGDIINNYFNEKIKPFLIGFRGKKIAFSVGIPFPSLINNEYLGHYDHVFSRNAEDIREIQKVVGSHRAHYIPDICLSYEANCKLNVKNKQKTCGVFLVGNVMNYKEIMLNIYRLVSEILLEYNVVLYSFNPSEDNKISEKIKDLILRSNKKYSNTINVDTKEHSTFEMIDIINNLDIAVCMRYHAHIFCAVTGTPLMSISSTRKTKSFMAQADISEYQYEIELNGYGTPISSNYIQMKKIYEKACLNAKNISYKLKKFLTRSRTLLNSLQPYRLACTEDNVHNDVAEFIERTGDHTNGARLLSNRVIGYPDSPFVWGMYEKFKNISNGDKGSLLNIISDSVNFLADQSVKLGLKFLGPQRNMNTLPIYIDLKEYQLYKDAHRGGWYLACSELSELNSINEFGRNNGIIFDMYLDRTFHWANSYLSHIGTIPYTGPWCGFVHHTQNTSYSKYNSVELFNVPEFIQSLSSCLFLFSLSENLSKYLRSKLRDIGFSNVKVITMSHPVDQPTQRFSISSYRGNKNKKLINIGSWMRNPFTIYSIKDVDIDKYILVGKDMSDHIPDKNFKICLAFEKTKQKSGPATCPSMLPCRSEPLPNPRWVIMLTEWLTSLGVSVDCYSNGTLYVLPFFSDSSEIYVNNSRSITIEQLNSRIDSMISSVKYLDHQSNDDYDKLLSENIVFLDLVDAAAVNTIIECIVRATPVLVNKIPGTVSILGEDYPLYYKSPKEISSVLNYQNIIAAHRYLTRLDTRKYNIKNFIEQIKSILLPLNN